MNSKNRKIYGIVYTLLGGLAWGFSACFGQYLFENVAIETDWLITNRLLIAGTIFTVIGIATRGKQTFAIFKNKKDTFMLVMFGLLGMMMCQYTFYETIKLANAGTAAVLQSLGTVFILLIVCIRKKQLPRLKQLIAIALAIFGVFLLNTNGDFSTITMSSAVLFYGLCSAAGVGFYSMLSERIIRKYGLYSVAGLGMIIGGLALVPFSRPWETSIPITVPLIVGMFGVIILGTAVAFGFYLKGVSIVGSLMGSLLGAMEPVSAVVLSAVILKSNFSVAELIAFALIIGNVFWLCLQEKEPKEKNKQNIRSIKEITMEFIHNSNDISVYNENGEAIATVAFPTSEDGTVSVDRTFVHESLRGMGVAGKLMQELVENLEKTNRKAVPTCSYAVTWFEKHPEHSELLQK